MLQILSKKQFNIAVILIIIALLPLQIATSFYTYDADVWQHSAPLSKFIFKLLGADLLSAQYFIFTISSILIYLQLFLVYNIFNTVKSIEKNSLLATWIYLWLIHLFPAMSNFSPALISITLVLFVIHQYHYNIEGKYASFLFNISIVSGIAFLIWYPSILILLFLILVLFQYNELSLKKGVIVLTSFTIPIIYFCCYFIFTNNTIEILYRLSNFHLSNLTLSSISIYQLVSLILILIMIVVGSFQALAFSSQTVKSSRLFMNSLFTFLIISLLGAFLSINNVIYSGIVLCFPISLFLVYYINIFKRPLYAEIAHLSLILLVLINFVLSF